VTWAGVDVGARKGFDLAIIDESCVEHGPVRKETVHDAVLWLRERSPRVVAVDSPCAAALCGRRSRPAERDLVRSGLCSIRYTPDEQTMRSHPTGYYDWVLNGFELYKALGAGGEWLVIECFPTASWTRLGGKRGARRRAQWSRDLLPLLGLGNLPSAMSQDARDAIVAAVTARLHETGRTESFGEIVVPVGAGRLD
jgi:predicted nuclease with RNAse H fold